MKCRGGKHGAYRRLSDGFTVLEIIIAIAILSLITAAASVSFTRSRQIRDLTTAGQNVLSILRVAQSKTLAAEGDSPWGVRLETGEITLFQGQTFADATYTESTPIPATVEIANVALAGGGTDIIFKRILGTTDQNGTFDVRVKENTSLVFPVTVEASGKAYQTGTAPVPTGTRVVDTRHRAFVLGWSIQTAATTTLIFENPPAPNTVFEIAMENYFDAPKTVFDWSGTVTVGMSPQTLRIHTTSLSSTDTTLHVDRDCRENTKKMILAIDGNIIATYEADCETITVGPYGGTMMEP